MRFTAEQMRDVKMGDEKALQKVSKDVDTIKAIKIEEVERRYNEITAKIKALTDEKHELMRAPMTKEELLVLAKNNLRGHKEAMLRDILAGHLKECQTARAFPFDPSIIHRTFDEAKGWRLAYFAISEKDVEEAVGQLEAVGIPEAERTAKLEKIDKDIAELSSMAEKESQALLQARS